MLFTRPLGRVLSAKTVSQSEESLSSNLPSSCHIRPHPWSCLCRPLLESRDEGCSVLDAGGVAGEPRVLGQ